ncbi:MAG: hypothetical protein MPJ24_03655 [Pirellulaceae bacterium]|nr:hypothetical protein [Pirellulaceae bacterium]
MSQNRQSATNVKLQKLLTSAQELYHQKPDWVTFFREILGADGIVHKLYPTPQEYAEFQKTEAFTQLQALLAQLRGQEVQPTADKEPQRVITVRIPKCLHETLRDEAHQNRTSINKLCITKLLQAIDGDLIPSPQASHSS